MGVEEFVGAALAILQARGMKTDFRRGQDLAFYRCEALSDRHLELVFRPHRWAIDYVFLPSKTRWRLTGEGVAELERSLGPLCEDIAFEPPTVPPASAAAFKQPGGR